MTNLPEARAYQPCRACPVCDALEGRLLFEQRFAVLPGGSPLKGYDVVVCDRCGCAYADGLPSQEVLDAYYRDMSKYEYQERQGRESQFDLARFRRICEIVQQIVPSREARIVDVGCATGGLLSVLKEAGYRNLLGVDPSPACAEAAMRLYGIRVVTSVLGQAEIPAGSCELVLLSAVLEHLRDAKPALCHLRTLLRQDGLIFVSVPDASRFAQFDDAPFQQFSTEHVNYFGPRSLGNLMRACGFMQLVCFQDSLERSPVQAYIGPVLDAVYRKEEGMPAALEKDLDTEPALLAYIQQCEGVARRIRQTIDRLVEGRRPILVWGVGTHTLRLLRTSRLAEADIAAFVDSNPRYAGTTLDGIPVIRPDQLCGRGDPILVSSRTFQAEILRQIRQELGLENEVFTLYDLPATAEGQSR